MSLSREREKLLERLKNPRLRRKEGLFLVEGIRGAREFLNPSLPLTIRFALVSSRLQELEGGAPVLAQLDGDGISTEILEEEELARGSDTEHPQGILLVVEEPGARQDTLEASDPRACRPLEALSRPRLLVLDGVQDPGNVGTLIRGAHAFGLDAVVALDGTADPWGPKTVRASAGALAHIPLFRMPAAGLLSCLTKVGIPLLVAEAGGESVRGFRPPEAWALVVGNEGAGIRSEIRRGAQASVSLAMAPEVDSLNAAVAGAILLFALTGPSTDHSRG